MKKKKPTVVSIYSGGGGLDVGFKNAGFEIVLATDNWLQATQTLQKNNVGCKVIHADIREVDFKKEIKILCPQGVDCVVGGPPCPAYSKSRFYRIEKKRALEDENAFTLSEFFRTIDEVKPKIFLLENVHGFVYKPHSAALEYVKKRSQELGYKISYKVINAANYGIPQTRYRFICVGSKNNLEQYDFPPETHIDPRSDSNNRSLKKWVTSGDAINDLDIPLIEDVQMQAGSKHKDLLKKIPPGDNYLYFTKERGYPDPKFKWRSRYWSFLLKLSPEKPSWTIQASHSNNMGPFHWQNRFLRINEIMRLQTFPDNYKFTGDFRSQWRQIGNAVPPLLAEVLAKQIRKQYFSD